MAISEKQVELVQASWVKVVPIADTAMTLFYGRLFELRPELRSLFKEDMTDQKHMLATMLNTAVNGLNNLAAIVPAVQALSVRHASYGVHDEDYDSVGSALLWTLEQGLGDAFDGDTKAAWAEVYSVLAGTMKDAAKQAVA